MEWLLMLDVEVDYKKRLRIISNVFYTSQRTHQRLRCWATMHERQQKRHEDGVSGQQLRHRCTATLPYFALD